jgi:hypothetical protein
VSVIGSIVATSIFVRKTMSPDASAFEIASFALLSSLLGLAMLEHWCLVLPLRLTALRNWWLRSPPKPANRITTDAKVEERPRWRLPADERLKVAAQLVTPECPSVTNSSNLAQADSTDVRADLRPKAKTSTSACQRLQERFRLEFAARTRVDTTRVCGSAGSDPSSKTNWRA